MRTATSTSRLLLRNSVLRVAISTTYLYRATKLAGTVTRSTDRTKIRTTAALLHLGRHEILNHLWRPTAIQPSTLRFSPLLLIRSRGRLYSRCLSSLPPRVLAEVRMIRSRNCIQIPPVVSSALQTTAPFRVRHASDILTCPGRKHRSPSPGPPDRSPEFARSGWSMEDIKPRSRGKTNSYDRNGVSRRQAKRDRARSHPPPIGHLGKHKLHY
jgi:hypothetical protein